MCPASWVVVWATPPLSRGAHVLVIRLHGRVRQRLPAAHLLGYRPRRRLHAEHDAVVTVVEPLPHVVGQLRAALRIELARRRVDLLVEEIGRASCRERA